MAATSQTELTLPKTPGHIPCCHRRRYQAARTGFAPLLLPLVLATLLLLPSRVNAWIVKALPSLVPLPSAATGATTPKQQQRVAGTAQWIGLLVDGGVAGNG